MLTIQINKNYTRVQLLQKINESIDKKIIDTWIYDSQGDFSHIPQQWLNQAWIRSYVDAGQDNELKFGLIGRKNQEMTKTLYGVYHGRFSEMLLTHFDNYIESIEISSMPDHRYDKF